MYSIGLPRLSKVLGTEGAARIVKEPRSVEGKGVFLALDNDISALFNSLNICAWVVGGMFGGLQPDDLAELFSSATGVDMSGDDLMKAGERIYNVEKAFNIREGVTGKDDYLPAPLLKLGQAEKGPPGPTGMSEADFETMLQELYRFKGWDTNGIPTAAKLGELGLQDLEPTMALYRRTGH